MDTVPGAAVVCPTSVARDSSELVRGVLDRIRASGKTLIPLCPFTAASIQCHPEYVDLVDPTLRGRFVPST